MIRKSGDRVMLLTDGFRFREFGARKELNKTRRNEHGKG
jgi:hypothetical protein